MVKAFAICGSGDDSQYVASYDGSLGVTKDFVKMHQAPVGEFCWNADLSSLYDDAGDVSDKWWTTGTLISEDLFLTAGHTFKEPGGARIPRTKGTQDPISPEEMVKNMYVRFNYLSLDPKSNTQDSNFTIDRIVEFRPGGLDYAIVRINGNPGKVYGYTYLSSADVSLGEIICIIGHPHGNPKMLEAGPVTSLDGDIIGYDDLDTHDGASGASILGSSGKIVGLHVKGGCDSRFPGENFGIKATSLIKESPTLASIANRL